MESYTVYRIDKTDSKRDAYTVNRIQTWEVVKDLKFSNPEDAQEYVISKNKQLHAIDLGLHCITDPDEIRYRCLDDPDLVHKRSYFIGKPNIKEIKRLLLKDHINIR